jgi:hypothetical protein
MGLMGPLTVPFTLAGLPFTTFVFERAGSYVPAFAIMLAAYLLSLTALALLRLPEQEQARDLLQEEGAQAGAESN